jgi:hypothetical protein
MRWPDFDIHAILAQIHRDIGWIKGQLGANTDRLDRIETRLDKRRLSLLDLLPWIYGAIILVLVVIGKLTALEGLGLIQPGR